MKSTEEYKYLSLKSFQQQDFKNTPSLGLWGSEQDLILDQQKKQFQDEYLLVIVDGSVDLSKSIYPKNKINLESELDAEPGSDSGSDSGSDKKHQLNIQDSLDRNLHLLFVNSSIAGQKRLVESTLILNLAAKVNVTVVENHAVSDHTAVAVKNTVQVKLSPEAKLNWIKWQGGNSESYYFSKSTFDLQNQSELKYWNIQTGSKISRQDLEVHASQPLAEAQVYVMSATDQDNVVDHFTSVFHHETACKTIQHHKNILHEKSKSNFLGRVFIQPQAQKADSQQLNNNLLLSDDAEVNSRPVLEIQADDVKATHGSTVGQISAEELFYLQSRGISKSKALSLLTQGFVVDLLQLIPDAKVRQFSESLFKNKMKSWQI
ncbi:MAG: SufD family Fe-S cluster assembly protein [Pseudobdellovibrionaceae bacterium]